MSKCRSCSQELLLGAGFCHKCSTSTLQGRVMRAFTHSGVWASVMAQQLWYEKQMELRWGLRLRDTAPVTEPPRYPAMIIPSQSIMPDSTREMEIGKAFHEKLSGRQVAYVPATVNIWMYCFLHEIRSRLADLLNSNLTRELPLFAVINSVPVICLVDELHVKDDSLFITEHKTRTTRKGPSPHAERLTRFQLMLYYRILRGSMIGVFSYRQLMDFYNIPPSAKAMRMNIHHYARATYSLFKKLPKLSSELTVQYYLQETGEQLATTRFDYNEERLGRLTDFTSQYWLMKRGAVPVGEKYRWKCNYCQVKLDCEYYLDAYQVRSK